MDPRIEQIERTQIYGLFDTGVLIYVGATKLPLRKRLNGHRSEAGSDPPIHQYLDSQVDDLHEDLEIRPLDNYESEKEALEDLSRSTLNVDGPTGPEELKHSWTPEEVDRLEELVEEQSVNYASQELDIPYSQAENAALKLGIDFRFDVDWDEWDHLLGTISDAELAEKMGCSRGPIRRRRRELGISAYRRPNRVDWDKWDDKLGTINDQKLADQIGCAKGTVLSRRRKLGIESARPYCIPNDEEVLQIRVWYAEKSEASHRSLAEEFGCSSGTIGRIVRGETREHLPMPEDLTEEEKEKILELSHNR